MRKLRTLSLLCFALLVFSGFAHAHHYATLELTHKVYRGGTSFTTIQEGAVYNYMMPNGIWGCTSPGVIFSGTTSRTTFRYTNVYGTASLSYRDFLSQTWSTTAEIRNTGDYADYSSTHYADKVYHGANIVNNDTGGSVSTSLYELRVGRAGYGGFNMGRDTAFNSQTRNGTNYNAVPVVMSGGDNVWSIYIVYKTTQYVDELPYSSAYGLVGNSVSNLNLSYFPELNDQSYLDQFLTTRSAVATPKTKGASKIKKLSSITIEPLDVSTVKLEGDTGAVAEPEKKVEEKKDNSKEKVNQRNNRTERQSRLPERNKSRERKPRR